MAAPIVIVIAVAIILIVGLALAFAWRRREVRLTPLNDEARQRYAHSWRVIETKFIDHPREAVREADQLVMSILVERGAHVDNARHHPRRLRDARRQADRSDGTEGLRKAMVHYQAIVDDGVGQETREAAERSRVEMA